MIKKLASWITKHPKTVILVALLLIIPSAIGYFATSVNYDILSYLPDNLDSVQGEAELDETFHSASMSIIIMKDMSWNDMTKLENNISQIDNVSSVLWLGSVADSPIPRSMLPASIGNMLYNADGDSTLMLVRYSTSGGADETLQSIAKIKTMTTKQCLLSGLSAVTYDLSSLTEQEAPKYIAIAIALALVALAFTMDSFVLPLVLLAALGLAVVYNMGTNFMFGQISFITQSIAAILQLGVTMDYSVFLMDRYTEEKPKYKSREAAMATAITGTFTSLAGSSLTTIFGFLALCFMSLTLGLDIGIVMAKGVMLGVITVVVVLPAMILLSENLINKTRHKSLVPPFHGLNKLTIKFRKMMAIIFVILIIPCYYGQNNVKKYYNMMNAIPDTIESIQALNILKSDFNMAGTHFVIIDDSMSASKKLQLMDDLENIDGVTSVLGLNSVVGTAISQNILPESARSILVAGGKQMIMVNSEYIAAEDDCNTQVDAINALIKSYDSSALLTGEPAMYKDLISVANHDFMVTSAISIAAIFVLIAIIFKSISIPFILVISIELAIWINMSISFVSGEVICFLTPTIISCVQLGATVDYAILLTTRFREERRKGHEKKEAMQIAADASHKSIFQSALVFFAATFGVYLICDIDIVKSICAMLARGALISAFVIVVFLTPLLVVCEKVISKTTMQWDTEKLPTKLSARSEKIAKLNAEFAEKVRKNAEEVKYAFEDKQIKKPKKVKKKAAIPVPAEAVTGTVTEQTAAEVTLEVKEKLAETAAKNAAKTNTHSETETEAETESEEGNTNE